VVEEMNPKQVEAVRATGANFWNVLIMAVVPQVMARFVGLSVYQFDSNIRNSTMVGIVGGGGIGAPLFTAYQRFDYDVVLTILMIIIAIIMVAELVSGRIRRIFQ
jgi:phosphonate transport system permease protein